MFKDIFCDKTAFYIGANDITLDCVGYTINYSHAGILGYGVDNSDGYDNITVKNCNIVEGTATTANKDAIFFSGSDNSTILNNTITTSGSGAEGIGFLTTTGGETNILNNTVTTTGSGAMGIQFHDSTVARNNVVKTQSSSGFGISLASADDCVVFNNNITTEGSNSPGIRFAGSNNNNISKNYLNTTGVGSSDGIRLQGNSNYNVLHENTIVHSAVEGISVVKLFAQIPNNNNLSKNIFQDVDGYDIEIGQDTTNTYLVDQSATNYSFYSSGVTVHFKNSSVGEIYFLESINGTGANLSSDVVINTNYTFVNTTNNVGLNHSANLTFWGVSDITNPVPMRGGVNCPASICSGVTNSTTTTFHFNVSGFTYYSVSHNNSAPPQVTLSSPGDTSSTNDRTPAFTWNAAVDPEGDPVTYVINVDNDNDFSSCIINESGISDTTYTPASDLDLDDTYYWRVRATDGEDDGVWSATWSFDLNSLLIIDLVSGTMDFGNVNAGTSYNTTTGSPNPFVLQNDGNALANISLNASSLFDSVSLPDSSYQAKMDNVTAETGSFNWIDSLTSWFNMPSATTLAIVELKYEDATDSVETDILITPPLDELAGSKSSSIIFTSILAE